MAKKGQRKFVTCPPPCGAVAKRKDSRRTVLPRILKVRLYKCEGGHQFETAETIVGRVVTAQRAKLLINRYTVRYGEGRRRRSDDYRL